MGKKGLDPLGDLKFTIDLGGVTSPIDAGTVDPTEYTVAAEATDLETGETVKADTYEWYYNAGGYWIAFFTDKTGSGVWDGTYSSPESAWAEKAGDYKIVVTAFWGGKKSKTSLDSTIIDVTVNGVEPVKPVITIDTGLSDATTEQGTDLAQTVAASIDPAGETLVYTFTVDGATPPAGWVVDGSKLTASGTVVAAVYAVKCVVSSATADPVETTANWTVTAPPKKR